MHKVSLAVWDDFVAALDQQGRSVLALADALRPEYLAVFDGIHTYNPVFVPANVLAGEYAFASLLSRVEGRLFAATVVPGYDEAYRGRGDLLVGRAGGDT